MYQAQLFNTEAPLHSSPARRYSLTEEGLALAERLEAAEHRCQDNQAGGKEEEKEENGTGVVDLTVSDDDQEESSRDHSPSEKLPCVTQPASQAGDTALSGKAHESQAAGCLLPGSYEIILCVDFIETTG